MHVVTSCYHIHKQIIAMIIPKSSTEATTAASTMDITPQRRPFQRLHVNSTAKQQLGENSKSTTKEACDKPVTLNKHSNVTTTAALDDSLELEEQREQDDEPRLLDEQSESGSCADLDRMGHTTTKESYKGCQNIFRSESYPVDNELESLWTLKRANPVLEDDTEDEIEELAKQYESPLKRQCAALDWDRAFPTDAPLQLTDAWRLS